jgi:hypothetical protein
MRITVTLRRAPKARLEGRRPVPCFGGRPPELSYRLRRFRNGGQREPCASALPSGFPRHIGDSFQTESQPAIYAYAE